jgi:CubicO group peptidase (beta-lactamase class C family)
MRRRLIATLITVCSICNFVSASGVDATQSVAAITPKTDSLRAIRTTLTKDIERGQFASVVVGAARGSAVLWLEGLGYADRESRVAATPDTIYPVASVSKSLTGTLAGILVQKGKIGWSDEVVRRIPGIAPGVTVRETLEQTSGLPHMWWYEFAASPASALGSQQLLSAARTTAFPPGTGSIYSNLNFEIAARYMEAALGEPYETIAARELWRPLGMRETTSNAWVGRPPFAAGYTRGNVRVPFVYRLAPRGGAGLFSSARDLLRFAEFHLGTLAKTRDLLHPASLADIHGDGTAAGRRGYSHGWGRIELGDDDFALLSDGAELGGAALILLLPRHQVAVVLLANTNSDLFDTATAIADAIEPGVAKDLPRGLQRLAARWATAGMMPSGTFSGSLEADGSTIALVLDFDAKLGPVLKIGGGAPRALSNIEWDRGILEASVAGDLPLPSDKDRSHELDLALHVGDSAIDGFATDSVGDLKHYRQYGVPYPVHLSKAAVH